MKIEVWSDFVCPFCYIGKRRLEVALAKFPHKDKVIVQYKSYELDPSSPKDVNVNFHQVLASKYGMSLDEAKKTTDGIAQQAASVGLTYHFDKMIPTNTFDAHRLAKFAQTCGKENEVTEKLLFAYFTESKHLGDHKTLADIAETVGLDRQEVLNVLADEQAFSDEVRSDEQQAQQVGVRGVPFFVINEKYAISGAQPEEVFLNALQKVWEEESGAPILQDLSNNGAEGASCTDGSCVVPNKEA
ncbi:DsbA family oxidoreductase [Bacillus aquiflavi]|uniref:DsbA family oxidoreductase n=1 Tax=Bacillus aquiflavi TaxID=2672567 RepID=A0A6B3W0F3_9BACI|nr:DsbA family oxidoreductase [Bacillus aquiflavi]MBA4537809.1 DsbA family oxidoreductase [Bacillus aquiflavi]NEY82065.1 DsbA family oxidoreductase [Bacillus aquiflavi]UAC48364.1 DsbA family oxidoreductase [Bacillus aquiflavi]